MISVVQYQVTNNSLVYTSRKTHFLDYSCDSTFSTLSNETKYNRISLSIGRQNDFSEFQLSLLILSCLQGKIISGSCS